MREDYNIVIVTPAKRVPRTGFWNFFLFPVGGQRDLAFPVQNEPPEVRTLAARVSGSWEEPWEEEEVAVARRFFAANIVKF